MKEFIQKIKGNEYVYIKGEVVSGKQLGRSVGVPTANISMCEGYRLPKLGVYATIIEINENYYFSITNVGRRPSVDSYEYITIEAHILDFEGDIYAQQVKLYFVEYIRDIMKLASLQEVKCQIDKDLIKLKHIFNYAI